MIGRKALFKLKMSLEAVFSLKCLLLTRIPFALYSNCSESRIVRKLMQLYCILYATTYIYTTSFKIHYNLTPGALTLYLVGIFGQALATITISLYGEEQYIITYCEQLKAIDRSVGIATSASVPTSCCLLWFGIAIRALCMYLNVETDKFSFNLFALIYNVSTVSIYASRVTTVSIYELLSNHMRSRRRYIQDKFEGSLTDDKKMFHLTTFLDTYKKLINILKPTFKFTTFIIVLSYTLDLWNVILMICHIANNFGGQDWKLVIWIIQSVLYFLALSGTSMFYQSAASELAKIQEIIAVQLLTNTDGSVRRKLRDVLDYVQYHPIVFCVWRHYPVDLGLCAGFFTAAATYTICILQFYY